MVKRILIFKKEKNIQFKRLKVNTIPKRTLRLNPWMEIGMFYPNGTLQSLDRLFSFGGMNMTDQIITNLFLTMLGIAFGAVIGAAFVLLLKLVWMTFKFFWEELNDW